MERVNRNGTDNQFNEVNQPNLDNRWIKVNHRNGDNHTYQVNHATEYKHTPRVCQLEIEHQHCDASQYGIDNHATPASHPCRVTH